MYLSILFKLVILTFAPIVPLNPKVTRPDPKKNLWTFCCDGWKSMYSFGAEYYAAKTCLVNAKPL